MRENVVFLAILLLVVSLLACGEKQQENPPSVSMPEAPYTGRLQEIGRDALEGTQELCPVTGETIDRNIYVDYQGKRIYFGNADALLDFESDPETYIKKLEQSGVQIEKSPRQ